MQASGASSKWYENGLEVFIFTRFYLISSLGCGASATRYETGFNVWISTRFYLVSRLGCISEMIRNWMRSTDVYRVSFAFEPRAHLQMICKRIRSIVFLLGFIWFWASGASSKWYENGSEVLLFTRFYQISSLGCIFKMTRRWFRSIVFWKVRVDFEPRVHPHKDMNMAPKWWFLQCFQTISMQNFTCAAARGQQNRLILTCAG